MAKKKGDKEDGEDGGEEGESAGELNLIMDQPAGSVRMSRHRRQPSPSYGAVSTSERTLRVTRGASRSLVQAATSQQLQSRKDEAGVPTQRLQSQQLIRRSPKQREVSSGGILSPWMCTIRHLTGRYIGTFYAVNGYSAV